MTAVDVPGSALRSGAMGEAVERPWSSAPPSVFRDVAQEVFRDVAQEVFRDVAQEVFRDVAQEGEQSG